MENYISSISDNVRWTVSKSDNFPEDPNKSPENSLSLDDFLILMAGQQTTPVINQDFKNLRVDYFAPDGTLRGYTTHFPRIKCHTLYSDSI